MSSFRRETDLLDSSGNWSRWEMNNLASDKQSATTQSKTSSASANTSGQAARQAPLTDFDRGYQKAREEALKEASAEGHTAGYAKGYEEGAAAAQKKMQAHLGQKAEETLQPIREMVRAFSASLDNMSEEVSLHLVEMASAIGRQLALDTLADKPELINALVRKLIDQDFSPSSRPQLLLHPKDLPLVEEQLGQELVSLGWQIRADEKITRGGCQLRSNLDQIDATWESRCRTLLSRVRRRDALPSGEVSGDVPDDGETES